MKKDNALLNEKNAKIMSDFLFRRVILCIWCIEILYYQEAQNVLCNTTVKMVLRYLLNNQGFQMNKSWFAAM